MSSEDPLGRPLDGRGDADAGGGPVEGGLDAAGGLLEALLLPQELGLGVPEELLVGGPPRDQVRDALAPQRQQRPVLRLLAFLHIRAAISFCLRVSACDRAM